MPRRRKTSFCALLLVFLLPVTAVAQSNEKSLDEIAREMSEHLVDAGQVWQFSKKGPAKAEPLIK